MWVITKGMGIDVSHKMCYHRTYLNTQLSRFLVVSDHLILAIHPPDLCPVSDKRIAPTGCSRLG